MSAFTFATLFSGAGGGSLGLSRAGLHCVGAVDSDPEAAADHAYLTGHPCTVADISEMQPHELAEACSARPDVLFTSPPCKGFSGCLPEAQSRTGRYVALNSLAERGIFLALEAWETPPPLIVMENVPRIQSRGRVWLDRVVRMLQSYGYAVRETTHDCGELGGLAQRRRRFLLVARHMTQVPEWLYEPPKMRVRGVGEVLGALPVPLPGGDAGGPMHRLPRLSALNWIRLALIPAGGDWRDLPASVRLQHEPQGGSFGVGPWVEPSHTVTGSARVGHAGVGAVADPRLDHTPGKTGRFGVGGWDLPSHTVTGARGPHDGWATTVSDPRLAPRPGRQNGGFGVEQWGCPSHAVIAEGSVRNTRASVADPRLGCSPRSTAYGVTGWRANANTVVGAANVDNGPWAVCDPRSECTRREGALGVRGWGQASAPVISAASVHNWPGGVAEPRLAMPTHEVVDGVVYGPEIDTETKRPTHIIIRAEDGTWHRPMTTLELAVLQSLPATVGGEPLRLAGRRDAGWRQRIGNMVPPAAAEAIGRECVRTLQASRDGMLLLNGSGGVWVSEVRA